MPILADYRRPGHHRVLAGWFLLAGSYWFLAVPAAQALRFGHAQCGSDDGVDDQVGARLRGEPAAAEPGSARQGLPGPGRARRAAAGIAERRTAQSPPGAPRL